MVVDIHIQGVELSTETDITDPAEYIREILESALVEADATFDFVQVVED